MQQELWPAPDSLPEPGLAERLRALGLPEVPAISTHRNRSVMVSWIPGRALRIHEGYARAPDLILQAIVRFLSPRTRRAAKLEARRVFLSFPVEQNAPSPGRRRLRERSATGDQPLLEMFVRLHAELNLEHFSGSLGTIPIRISRRMRRKLGELRLDREGRRAVEIALSRRHVRSDGWQEARKTLLHEMVHQWQAETGLPVDHGTAFRKKAREVGIEPRAVREAAGVDGGLIRR